MSKTLEQEKILYDTPCPTPIAEGNINGKCDAKRDFAFDNIRFLLIISVVFAHLLGIGGHDKSFTYMLIYSFHMPAFIFLFGYFAKHRPDRIVVSWIIPYVIFQALYIVFDNALGGENIIQFATPHWLMWYMMVCIFYQLLMPVYNAALNKNKIAAIVSVFVLALLVGYDKSFSYYASLSRFFVFQPWFVLGLYFQKYKNESNLSLHNARRAIRVCLITAGVVASGIYLYISGISAYMLYGVYPYTSLEYGPLTRAIGMIIAFLWIAFLFYAIKPYISKKIPLITGIGQNTLSIYLLHGFVVKIAGKYFGGILSSQALTFIVAIIIVLIFGNTYIGRLFKFVFSGYRAEKSNI